MGGVFFWGVTEAGGSANENTSVFGENLGFSFDFEGKGGIFGLFLGVFRVFRGREGVLRGLGGRFW